jgi:transcriptional regulator with XRE-family HTH domain
MAMETKQIIEIIQKARKHKKLSYRDMQKKSGISYTQVRAIELGKVNTSLKSLICILKALDMKLELIVVPNRDKIEDMSLEISDMLDKMNQIEEFLYANRKVVF